MPTRYYLSLPDPKTARGSDAAWPSARTARTNSPRSCRTRCARRRCSNAGARAGRPRRGRSGLGATDPQATVSGEQDDLHIDLVATTSMPGILQASPAPARGQWLGTCATSGA